MNFSFNRNERETDNRMQTRTGAMTYLTHDNGGRAFKVWYKHPTVQVYAVNGGQKVLQFKTDQFMVGTSPLCSMTEFSGGDGPEFDGNSVIARVAGKPNEYIHVGCEVFSFRTLAPIVKYSSPVGNNDVPYPWAADELGNVYLMIEGTILKATEKLNSMPKDDQFDPYGHYYETEKKFKCEHPVTKEVIQFRYSEDPAELFERLKNQEREFPEVKQWKTLGKDIFCKTVLLWGEQNGYSPLNQKMIARRSF